MTRDPQPLRIGVIGVGFGATVHVPGFLSEGWAVPVVWSRRIERAREQAARLEVPEVAEDWREIVGRDDLDAVAVTTPPAAHYEIVAAALRAGKHVLCEKPFALNTNEARAMRDLAREHGRTAMVAHEFRFAPQRAQIKDLLDEGRIGTPELVSAELLMGRPRPDTPPPYTWASDRSQGGGLLGALGSHYIDGLRHWFGDVIEVSGRLATRTPERVAPDGKAMLADTDDTFAVTLLFENGVVASMVASSQVAPSLGARITVAGSDGVLVATQRGPNPEPDGIVLAGRAGDRELAALPVDPKYVPIEDARDQRLAAFRLLVREFERGIREGSSPAPSFDDALACQEVLDAVRAASYSGRLVRLSGDDGTAGTLVAGRLASRFDRFTPRLSGRRDGTATIVAGGTGTRFDRFTPRAREALTRAQQEAQRRGGEPLSIGNEHLLLAVAYDDGPAARALATFEIDAARIAAQVDAGASPAAAQVDVGLSRAGKRAIEAAVQLARELDSSDIDSPHLLAGVAASGGEGARILEALGATPSAVRDAVVRVLGG
jgi:predicted dehydrogenase